jgi:hypothetical protein
MRELEVLLKRHDNNIEFNHLNNRIRCYPHIINICSSHIIASSTRISKKFLETFNAQSDADLVYSNFESDDDDDNDNDNDNDGNGDLFNNNNNNNNRHSFARETDIPELILNEEQVVDLSNDKLRAWYRGLKRDPIKRARRIVRIVRSSDQRKQVFRNVIKTFKSNGIDIDLPDLELLRDVKTRWDSVYCMIDRLLVLRPVSFLFVHIVRI